MRQCNCKSMMTNVMSSPTPGSDSGLPSEIWIDYSSINLEYLALKRAETEISSAVNKYEQNLGVLNFNNPLSHQLKLQSLVS